MKTNPVGPIDALIVQGNNRQGLAVARSLARHGVSFILVSDQPEGPASHSRAVRHQISLLPQSLRRRLLLNFFPKLFSDTKYGW